MTTVRSTNWGFEKLKRKLPRIQKELLKSIGNDAVNHFQEGFREGGGKTNMSTGGWQPRKSNRDNEGRAILVKTGDLMKSIHVFRQETDTVRLKSDLVYSKIHNGTTGGRRVRGNAFGTLFKMPIRNYMGHSKELDKKNIEKVRRKITKEWRDSL